MITVRLLDQRAPEDPVLAAVELPRLFDVAVTAIAAGIVAVAVAGSLLLDDGDDRLNLLLTAVVAPPALVRFGRPSPLAAGAERLVPLVLVPAAALTVVDLATGDSTLGFAPQFLLYLCLLALGPCTFAPRRRATMVVAATYLVFVARGLASPEPAVALVPWLLALTFATFGLVGVRIGGLGIARAQQAAAEREALDDRRRVAHEIHDVVAHTLAVTMRHVGAARLAVDRSAADPSAVGDAVAALEEAERHGRIGLADIRRTVRLLRADGGSGPGPGLVP